MKYTSVNPLQSSPAPATSGSGGGSWAGPPYHGPDYPAGGPSTPNSSQGTPSSASNSKLKEQDQGGSGKSGSSQSLAQKQADLLSPHNAELRKTGSISSLRDALLATTASAAPSTQQYGSYSSPRMVDHQASPVTPSTNLPTTPEPTSSGEYSRDQERPPCRPCASWRKAALSHDE